MSHVRLGALVAAEAARAVIGLVIAVFGGILVLGWLGLTITVFVGVGFTTNAFIIAGFIFVILGLLGMYFTWYGLTHRTLRIAVHEGGLVETDRGGSRTIPWSEVEGVFDDTWVLTGQGITTAPRSIVRVAVRGGAAVVVDDRLPRSYQLGRVVVERVSAALAPRYQDAFAQRAPLHFGPIILDPEAIHVGRQRVPWTDVATVSFEGFEMRVNALSGFFALARLEHKTIPNVRLLQDALRRIGRLRVTP